MNILQEFPSAYLKALDYPMPTVEVIDQVKREVVGQERENKPVLYFDGHDRGVVLNKTNATMLATLHGPETKAWKGQRVEVYKEAVAFQGKIVDSIRLREAPEADKPFEDEDIAF
jgi:hypothetical protein